MAGRLDAPAGLLIDRSREISFEFEGREYGGYAGDTVASALMANGVRLLSRSFKYHRPRGALTMAGQDANTLIQVGDEPSVLADRIPLAEGLVASGQNYSGSLERDRNEIIGKFSGFLPVGFYYKAFYRPKGIWQKLWEPFFRRMTGLGKVNPRAKHRYYDKKYEFCDVAVVGGGPAGMGAAAAAAEAGAEVILIDENAAWGGSLNYARFDPDPAVAARARDGLVDAVEASPNIRRFLGATCNGWFADHYLPVIAGDRLHKLRARRLVVAAGSIEQPIVFRNNDLPGIMLGSAAQRLVKLYGVRPGDRAAVATANSDGYGVALDLLDAGVEVAAVVDLRSDPPQSRLYAAVAERKVRILQGRTVYEAIPGARGIRSVLVRKIASQGACEGEGETIDCDLLCMSPGYMPAYHLPCQGGAEVGYDDESAAFTISGMPEGMSLAGSVCNVFGLDAAIGQGRAAGMRAASELGFGDAVADGPGPSSGDAPGEAVNHPWPIFPHPEGKDFVDFDEDLQVCDIVNSVADGYAHVQLVKRYSTAGMGPSQGRHAALPVARLVARANGKSVGETGVTTARPPVGAEKLGVMAGRIFTPERHTPMHERHLELGACMIPAGQWWRPAFYGPRQERARCLREESLNVRGNVGMIDVSTLGGLEVRGPDASELLNRMYTLGFAKQPVGGVRYLLMCNEEGVAIDDGVACRLHERHFYVTATTSGVDAVYRLMLRWIAEWRLDVDVAQVSAAWCGVNLAGPKSRDVLGKVCGLDLSEESFPYLKIREAVVAGIPARLLRIGFVGELGYEIHVPSSRGEALWDALMDAGEESGIRPFGVETQRLLRLEKGHIIIGQDTDSMSNPLELDMEWALSRKKPFFLGGRSLEIIGKGPPRRKLAGFEIRGEAQPKPEESHLVIDGEEMAGRVTSCEFSPTLGKTIGLATIRPDLAEEGASLRIRCDGGTMVEAKVAKLPFYDPSGGRQKA